MKLLVFTQKIDINDPVLGFFHSWVKGLSEKADSVTVICLSKGVFEFPSNVTVYSLGKETDPSKFSYLKNLYNYLYVIDGTYDNVFVHMNQEYVILAGLYWKLKGIPVYMWRNHPNGSLLTRLAVSMCKKVFTTSAHSFTAQFKKTVIMPAGIDTKIFKTKEGVVRKKYSVCMVGRVSPIKHVDMALEAIKILIASGVQTTLSIIGPVLSKDEEYMAGLKKFVADNNLSTIVYFEPAVTMDKLPEVYSGHEICLNLTDAGSFDKTVIEAASCGTIPLVSNESFSGLLPDAAICKPDANSVALSIERIFHANEKIHIQKDLEEFVQKQSLESLLEKLTEELK